MSSLRGILKFVNIKERPLEPSGMLEIVFWEHAGSVRLVSHSSVLQNMCGGGTGGEWCKHVLALKQYCSYVTRRRYGGRTLLAALSFYHQPHLWAISMTWVAFVYVSDWFVLSNPEGGVTASTIFICRKIFLCLLYPCFLGRGPIISCIFYLYIACFYARLNTMYASLV